MPEHVRTGSTPRIAIATNNGDMGGGEVMLLNIAEALREIGISPLVIGPQEPGDLVARAESAGFEAVALAASGRAQYMRALALWRLRNRRIPLWCNGLVPSLATAGLGPRIAHLHILPQGAQRIAAMIARIGARRTLTISRFMASRVPGTVVLENWTQDLQRVPRRDRTPGAPWRVGFLGRLTRDKGVHDLARAVQTLRDGGEDVHLVLAGENRFGSGEDDRAISAALAPLGEAVEHLGWADREEFFASVDLAVFPSRWEEPFGLVAAEAMAAGVPFVITDSGALPEVVGSEYPWVARRADPEDLARVLAQALSAAPAHRDAVLAQGRRRWEQRYSPGAGRERVRRLLKEMTS